MRSWLRAWSTWVPRLPKLLSQLGFGRPKVEAYPVAPLVGISRTPLGVEAYDLCPEDRRLVAELTDEYLFPTDLEAYLKEIGNRLDGAAGSLLDAASLVARAEKVQGEIGIRISIARDSLDASEARLTRLVRRGRES